nr:hypothetical protein [uncultured Actinoplanes sp.]
MKFFSNDAARDTSGAPAQDEDRDRTDEVAAVPQQRAGSPWSDAPGDPRTDMSRDRDPATSDASDVSDASDASDAELAEQERRDGSEEGGHYDVDAAQDRAVDPDRTEVVRDDADRTMVINNNAGDDGPRDDSPVDLALDDDRDRATTTTYGPDGTAARADGSAVEQDALRDDGTFDSPTVVQPATGEPVPTPDSSTASSDTAAAHDETPEPVVAAAAAPVPSASSPTSSSPSAAASPAAEDRFFPDGDGLADRFRDIQLRFVDSPKEATAEAAGLVDEALDKLAGALKSRRDSLASNSDDTEKLRVELRGYRELLNRILGL